MDVFVYGVGIRGFIVYGLGPNSKDHTNGMATNLKLLVALWKGL